MPGPKLAVDLHADASDLNSRPINITTLGVNVLVPADPFEIIQVWRILLVPDLATQITFQHGAVLISGPIPLAANEGFVLDFDTKPWMTTGAGQALDLNNSAATLIGGIIYYTTLGSRNVVFEDSDSDIDEGP